MRGTGFDQSDTLGEHGRQLNVTAGIGRKLAARTFSSACSAATRISCSPCRRSQGRMTGDGGTVGGYMAWRFADHWRIDGKVGWTDVTYDGTAASAVLAPPPASHRDHSPARAGSALAVSPAPIASSAGCSSRRRASTRCGSATAPSPTRSAPRRPRAASRKAAFRPAPRCSIPWLVGTGVSVSPYVRRLWRLPILDRYGAAGRRSVRRPQGWLVGARDVGPRLYLA